MATSSASTSRSSGAATSSAASSATTAVTGAMATSGAAPAHHHCPVTTRQPPARHHRGELGTAASRQRRHRGTTSSARRSPGTPPAQAPHRTAAKAPGRAGPPVASVRWFELGDRPTANSATTRHATGAGTASPPWPSWGLPRRDGHRGLASTTELGGHQARYRRHRHYGRPPSTPLAPAPHRHCGFVSSNSSSIRRESRPRRQPSRELPGRDGRHRRLARLAQEAGRGGRRVLPVDRSRPERAIVTRCVNHDIDMATEWLACR
jgi:hypothetical protein